MKDMLDKSLQVRTAARDLDFSSDLAGAVGHAQIFSDYLKHARLSWSDVPGTCDERVLFAWPLGGFVLSVVERSRSFQLFKEAVHDVGNTREVVLGALARAQRHAGLAEDAES